MEPSGIIKLSSLYEGELLFTTQESVEVFDTHLDRDMANYNGGKLNEKKPDEIFSYIDANNNVTTKTRCCYSPGNCGGAACHAFNGTLGTTTDSTDPPWPVDPVNDKIEIYSADPDPTTHPNDGLIPDFLYLLQKGDVVQFLNSGDGVGHIATICDDLSTGIWEFNGQKNPCEWGFSSIQDELRVIRNGSRVVTKVILYKNPNNLYNSN